MKKTLVVLVVVGGVLVGMAVGASAQPTEAWIPGLASFLIPGIGQFLNGEITKGIVHLIVGTAIPLAGGVVVAALPSVYQGAGIGMVGIATLAYRLYSGYDAYTVAEERGFSLGLTQDGLTLAYRF